MSTTEANTLATGAYSLFIVALITAYLHFEKSWQKKKENSEPIEAYFKQAIADFPEPPEGMQFRVQRSERRAKITWFRTVPKAWNNAEKCACFFLVAPIVFVFGLIPLLRQLSMILSPGDGFLFLIFPLAGAAITTYVLICAYRLTPERTYWELDIAPRLWRVTIDRPGPSEEDSNPPTEVRELIPSHGTHLGVDVGGQVYCEVITESLGKVKARQEDTRVDLTPLLSKTEAAWLEQALRSLL